MGTPQQALLKAYDEQNGLPVSLSNDGCHPNPDTYFIMEKIALEKLIELRIENQKLRT